MITTVLCAIAGVIDPVVPQDASSVATPSVEVIEMQADAGQDDTASKSAMLVAFTLHNPDAAGPVDGVLAHDPNASSHKAKRKGPPQPIDGLSETPAFTARDANPSNNMFQLIDEKWRIADEFEQENFFKAHL